MRAKMLMKLKSHDLRKYHLVFIYFFRLRLYLYIAYTNLIKNIIEKNCSK